MDSTHVESKSNCANTYVYDTAIDKGICSRISHPYTIRSLALFCENPLSIMIKRKEEEKRVNYKLFSYFGGHVSWKRCQESWEEFIKNTVGLHLPKHAWTSSPLQRKNDWLVHCELNSHELSCPKSHVYYIIASNFVGAPLDVNSQLVWHLENSICLLSRKEICSLENFARWKIFRIML